MSVLLRLIAGRFINRIGQSDIDRKLAQADAEFWSTLRASVAEHAAETDVQQANTEAQQVTKETLRKIARGEIENA